MTVFAKYFKKVTCKAFFCKLPSGLKYKVKVMSCYAKWKGAAIGISGREYYVEL